MKNTVLVFGATGLLGATLCPQLKLAGWCVIRQSRSQGAEIRCDPSNLKSVRDVIKDHRPVAIVNLVANSNVDYCESHLSESYITNVRTVENLAIAINEINTRPHLVHISSDHLYAESGPHSERSVLPINVYALTKFTGELFALQSGATVLRTNFFGRSRVDNRSSFTDWIYNSLSSARSITVFEDVLFSALHMVTLSTYITKAIEYRLPGIFNVGSREGLSKAKFAEIFADILNLDKSYLKFGSIKDVKLEARRPLDMRMDIDKFESKFDLIMPNMVDQISKAAAEYTRIKHEIR